MVLPSECPNPSKKLLLSLVTHSSPVISSFMQGETDRKQSLSQLCSNDVISSDVNAAEIVGLGFPTCHHGQPGRRGEPRGRGVPPQNGGRGAPDPPQNGGRGVWGGGAHRASGKPRPAPPQVNARAPHPVRADWPNAPPISRRRGNAYALPQAPPPAPSLPTRDWPERR